MFIKKFLGAMLLLAILALPQNVFAEKTDYTDRNFYFRNIRTVIVFDVSVTPGVDPGGVVGLRSMQSRFLQDSLKLPCRIINESQARQIIGAQVGMNLEALAISNPLQARQIVMQNAYAIGADAWITSNIDAWGNTTYVEPERTVWESRRQTRRYYDQWGRLREESYTTQVPVTYPPRRVDISTVQVTMQTFDSRTGAMIFARKDVRDREDYSAQTGMFGRISNSFFEDLAKKFR